MTPIRIYSLPRIWPNRDKTGNDSYKDAFYYGLN